MNFDFSNDDEAFRSELRGVLEELLPPDWQGICVEGNEKWQWTMEFCAELGRRGWLTQAWPREYGGNDADVWRQTVLQEELWAHNEPRGSQYMNVNWIGPAFMHFGTEEQKMNFLPRIAEGSILFGQLFSEPDAGSDLANLKCRAEEVEGGFLVNGEKIWTSYGDIAHYGFLLARSEPTSRRKEGLSVLIVDLSSPGIERRPIKSVLGYHRINEFHFQDCFVPDSALLGTRHDGWRVANTALSFERSGSARYARSARIMGLAEQHSNEWSEQERQRFAELLAFARATELVNYRVAGMKGAGKVPRAEASMARIHNSLLEVQLSEFLEDVVPTDTIIGGSDELFADDNAEIEALWRNAAAATVTAGSYEIQMGIVAQTELGLGVSK